MPACVMVLIESCYDAESMAKSGIMLVVKDDYKHRARFACVCRLSNLAARCTALIIPVSQQ